MADALDLGREAFSRRSWAAAHDQLAAADAERTLEAEDLERFAVACFLTGDSAASTDAWSRAHQQFLSRGEPSRAVRCAFWLAYELITRGDMAQAGGWLARGQRVLDEAGLETGERGYLLLPAAIEGIDADPARSYDAFSEAAAIGERFHDADLMSIARHGQGRALIRLNRTAEGMALLDEVMVAATSGELSPMVAGDAYCGLVEACQEVFDVRRAREWTDALQRWCESQTGLLAFRGQCLVYRASIMQMHGAWHDAMNEAGLACQRLADEPAAGAAYYQRAEIHRLRGELQAAEADYRRADEHGRTPQPGLALLRLAQGQPAAAAASMRRVMDEHTDRLTRSGMLAACVEIALAANDVPAARAAAEELADIAEHTDAQLLRAMSHQAEGAVLLAEREFHDSLNCLRRAHAAWRELDAPYETARTRVLIALICGELGDDDGAAMELQAAREAFERLGATPDLLRVRQLSAVTTSSETFGLTPRELDILRLVATGKTNRAIADDLVLSEKTVARHVSNIFGKLGVSTRTAATAFAYEHQLL